MRPYWAIIRDSFREAMASRVLWVLLAMITLLLILLAPFGYRDEITTGLRRNDIPEQQWLRFIELIRTEGAQDKQSASRVIWTNLDRPLQRKLNDFAPPEEGDVQGALSLPRTINQLRVAIDTMMKDKAFFDREAWRDVPLLSPEARRLTGRDVQLTDKEIARRNRLLLEAAFPEFVEVSPPTSVQFRYLIWNFGPPVPFQGNQFTEGMGGIVAWLANTVVGWFGIGIAVLITASMIPQTFDAGSLNLLLSKPVSRSLLFLSKFAGGCAFICINGAYLILGLWIILAVRLGVWQPKLLLCIPIYLFVFAIYYSVSALAGVIWRNTIMCIVISALFAFVCWFVGLVKTQMETQYFDKIRISKLVPAGDTLVSVNEIGLASAWDDESNQWKEAFISKDQKQLGPMLYMMPTEAFKPIGPIYDQNNDQLVAIHRSFGPAGFGKMVLNAGKREEDWECVGGASAPVGTFELLRDNDGTIVAVSSMSVHRLVGDPQTKTEPVKIFGVSVPLTGGSPFQGVVRQGAVIMTQPAAAALNPVDGKLALYTRGEVTLMDKDEQGNFTEVQQKKLNVERGQAIVMACSGNTLLVARDDGHLSVYDTAKLEERKAFRPEGNNQPRFVRASPNGRWFAILFHNQKLWLLDAEADVLTLVKVRGQRDISAVEFAGPNELLVADRTSRVSQYRLPAMQLQHRWSPTMGLFEVIYRYVIRPIYIIFPKPGQLDNTIQYVLTGKETETTGAETNNLSAAQSRIDPWTPVWSSLLFMLIVLAISCVYIERQDF